MSTGAVATHCRRARWPRIADGRGGRGWRMSTDAAAAVSALPTGAAGGQTRGGRSTSVLVPEHRGLGARSPCAELGAPSATERYRSQRRFTALVQYLRSSAVAPSSVTGAPPRAKKRTVRAQYLFHREHCPSDLQSSFSCPSPEPHLAPKNELCVHSTFSTETAVPPMCGRPFVPVTGTHLAPKKRTVRAQYLFHREHCPSDVSRRFVPVTGALARREKKELCLHSTFSTESTVPSGQEPFRPVTGASARGREKKSYACAVCFRWRQ